MNMGGVSIEAITAGSQNGMTHRFLLFYTLGPLIQTLNFL
jgi:hypothetical protein